MHETALGHLFIAAVPHHLPDVRVFERPIINVEAKQGFRVRSGIVGQCDLYAVVRGGKHVELELKQARGSMRNAQIRWQQFCESFGIPHLVLKARKDETPDATVARWCRELEARVTL